MRFEAWRGLSDEYRGAVEGHAPWSKLDSDPDPLVVPDVERDPSLTNYLPIFLGNDVRGLVFIPITHRRQVVGEVHLTKPVDPEALHRLLLAL